MAARISSLSRQRICKAILVGTCLAGLPGCAGRSSDIPYAPSAFNVEPDRIFAENPEYRLGSSDVVTVSVYRAPELAGEHRLDASGNIMLPMVGQIRAQGLTIAQLAAGIREELGREYFVDPDVSVSLKEAASQRITLDGSVEAPGVYPVPGPTTLMQAVALGGGVTQDANLRKVVIFRQIEGQRMAAAFDLKEIRAARMEDPVVYASDIIVVDGSQTRQNMRDILSTIPILALFRPLIL